MAKKSVKQGKKVKKGRGKGKKPSVVKKRLIDAGKDKTHKYGTETDEDLANLPPRFTIPEVGNQEDLSPSRQRDQLATVVEHLMLKGVNNEFRIAALLGLPSIRVVRDCKARVLDRWDIGGVARHKESKRELIVRKYAVLEEKLWDLYDESVNPAEKSKFISQLMYIYQRQTELHGLLDTDVTIIQNNTSIQSSKLNTDTVSDVASKFLNLVQGSGKVIEHDKNK